MEITFLGLKERMENKEIKHCSPHSHDFCSLGYFPITLLRSELEQQEVEKMASSENDVREPKGLTTVIIKQWYLRCRCRVWTKFFKKMLEQKKAVFVK